MPESNHDDPDDKFGLDRIVFFSDAVIAIAITLLVIDIHVPELVAGYTSAALTRAVVNMWPRYLGFIVSFWVIAAYWIAHHRIFRYIIAYDRALIYINLLFLMFIAFMPYATSLLFRYPAYLISVGTYAVTVTASGISLVWLWWHVARKRQLIGSATPSSTITSISRNLLITPVAFLVSLGIAFFNPQLAMYSWIILLPLYAVFRRSL